MNKLISVVGASGVGKTTFVNALAKTGLFATAFEQHAERPFQSLFKQDQKYALANQMDYLLLRAEQEKQLRAGDQTGLMDGGLDLDFHGFTRLFHRRGLLANPEFDLCLRLYSLCRELLPPPDLVVRLNADEETVTSRLSARERINIANAEDTTLFDSFLDEWLASLPSDRVFELNVSDETREYTRSIQQILNYIQTQGEFQ